MARLSHLAPSRASYVLELLACATHYATSRTCDIGQPLLDPRNAPKRPARNRAKVGLRGLRLAPSTRKCIGHKLLPCAYLLTCLLSGTRQPCLQSGGLASRSAYCPRKVSLSGGNLSAGGIGSASEPSLC